MAPFQTTVTIRQENVDNIGQNVVDVQISPEEDNWAENTTVITGNTSERSESIEEIDQWSNEQGSYNFTCSRYLGSAVIIAITSSAFLSPLVMVILPKLGFFGDTLSILTIQQKLLYSSCNIECKGHLLGLAFKVTLLGIGNWIIFLKSRESIMPRIFMFRTGVLILTTLCLSTYWLFYVVQVRAILVF